MSAVITVVKLTEAMGDGSTYGMRLWMILAGVLAAAPSAGVRTPRRAPGVGRSLQTVEDLLVTALAVLGSALAVAWIAPAAPSPLLVLVVFLVAAALVVTLHSLLSRMTERALHRPAYLIYGHNDLGQSLARVFQASATGPDVVGFIDESKRAFDNESGPTEPDGPLPVFRDVDEAVAKVPPDSVAGVIIAMPHAEFEDLAAVRKHLRDVFGMVYLAPPAMAFSGDWPLRTDPAVPGCFALGARKFSEPVRVVKRGLDIVVASIALLVFLPALALCALLIKLESPGPVIFRQRRFTTDNRLFECYKLRTMRLAPPQTRIELTTRNDNRVTRVGRFLRRTSLDEIPQFINVLQGHMSVVGPRPHPPGVMAGSRTYEEIVPDFDDRYKVKPGLTGFAQVSGLRGNTFTEEDLLRRFEYDLDYISHWSLPFEFWIIARTFINGFWGKNAF